MMSYKDTTQKHIYGIPRGIADRGALLVSPTALLDSALSCLCRHAARAVLCAVGTPRVPSCVS